MKKPTSVIYSDKLFSALCLKLNPGGGVPPGATAKEGGVGLAWIEETLQIGRRVPENGLLISEDEKFWKVRAGSLADVAPVCNAYGDDMAAYKTIVFDLDFELAERTIHRIVELNLGVSGQGHLLSPVTWPTLAAQDHLILLVLTRSIQVGASSAQKRLSPTLGNPPSTNYDLLHGLPFKFKPLQDFGRVLAPDNYALDDDLDNKLRSALVPWIKNGTAFRVADQDQTPIAVKRSSFCSIPSEGQPLTIAGAFRYEKSLLAFLPMTALKPAEWIKTVAEISAALDCGRRSPKWVSKMSEASALDHVILIARPLEDSRRGRPVSLSIEVNGTEFPVKVPPRGGRAASNFNKDHQWLIHLSKEHRLMEIDDMIEMIKVASGETWTVKKVSQLMTALRKGVEAALVEAGLASGLAAKIFPEDKAGVSNRIRRENIRVPKPPVRKR